MAIGVLGVAAGTAVAWGRPSASRVGVAASRSARRRWRVAVGGRRGRRRRRLGRRLASASRSSRRRRRRRRLGLAVAVDPALDLVEPVVRCSCLSCRLDLARQLVDLRLGARRSRLRASLRSSVVAGGRDLVDRRPERARALVCGDQLGVRLSAAGQHDGERSQRDEEQRAARPIDQSQKLARSSLPVLQSLGERVGQAGRADRGLRARDVVLRAAVGARSGASVSSSSQAARGSPSRGWPVEPGLISHSPRREVELGALARASVPGRRLALRAVEGQRDVRVADERDAEVGRVEAQLGGQRRRGRTPRSGRAGRRGRARAPSAAPCGCSESRNSRVSARDHVARPARGERGAARELVQREHLDDREVVVAGQADRAVARRRARRRRPARRRSRRGRRGTTAPRRPPPRRRRSPPRRRGGCRGCRCRWRPACGVSSIRCRSGSACPPPSSPRWSSRRRRCCSCGRASGTRVDARGAASLLQRGGAGARRRASAPASCWLYGARTALELGVLGRWPCGSRRGGPARPVLDRRGGRRGAHAGATTVVDAAARAPSRASARKDVGLVTQCWGGWAVDVGQGRRDRRRAVGGRRRAAGRSACAASAALVGRPAPPRSPASRVVFTLPRPGRARPGLQQVHAAAGGRDPRRRARARRARRRATSARSTRSTPRAARPPPTPT